ncbi:hypothetical protein FHG64_09535 [Antarcticibacterium flavum]|uniref:Glutaminyl-tRNA synthetase n=1 Tax=Antarcticibacterium flavum TaxID=2058175 RepID=A0A5B7X2R4_9FLAO|nr:MULTISPECIES: DUF6327 family protein [Antarcticibacterium]MCM4159223.1 hypothetical protein [Antarcticibacterium sp. W02-3]QCY69619.1 hypothetical protein FHG64_09535 [Antarcticibacterium flavum]
MKQYSSFEEIDRDLKILKLQNEIDKEEIKLSIQETKDNMSPLSLAGSLITSAVKKAIALKAIAKLWGKKLKDKK